MDENEYPLGETIGDETGLNHRIVEDTKNVTTTSDGTSVPMSEKILRTTHGIDELALSDIEKNSKRYRHFKLLGQGGGGAVYAARDSNFDRTVAIKVSDNPKKRKQFIHEAQVSAQLEHPNILPVFDIAENNNHSLYFTMRKADGKSLGELLEDAINNIVAKVISDHRARISIMVRICDAIAYAHHRGFIHRDIKPDNIMIGDFGEVLMVDWGTAIRCENAQVGKL
ncbi:MAG: serine/threonine protein kinase, partial [Planctomycetes bacterium]|nr:serine/threonine protein kinase [Planctomycetota bacterium]